MEHATQGPQVVEQAPAGREVDAQLFELVGDELERLVAARHPGARRSTQISVEVGGRLLDGLQQHPDVFV